MDHEIQLFHNDEFGEVRTVIIDGEPWFVGRDVASILMYANTRKALLDHVDTEDKRDGVTIRDSIGREQNPVLINESGVYSLILSSKQSNAKRFKHWVTSEILPTIRKTGGYMIQDSTYFIDKYFTTASAQQRLILQSAMAEIETLTRQIAENKPKVEFADQVADSSTLIDMNALAKLTEHNGFPIGRNRLFKWLRFKRILMPSNIPYQEYIERGFFEIRECIYTVHGDTRLSYKTLVTGKGQIYVITRLRKEYLDDVIPSEV